MAKRTREMDLKVKYFFQVFRDYWSYYPVNLSFDKDQEAERKSAERRLDHWRQLIDQVPDDKIDELVLKVSGNLQNGKAPNLQAFWNRWRMMSRELNPNDEPDPEEFLRQEKEAAMTRMATPAFNFRREGFPPIRKLELEELPSWVKYLRKSLHAMRSEGLISMSKFIDHLGDIDQRSWAIFSIEEQKTMLSRWKIEPKPGLLNGSPGSDLMTEAKDRMRKS